MHVELVEEAEEDNGYVLVNLKVFIFIVYSKKHSQDILVNGVQLVFLIEEPEVVDDQTPEYLVNDYQVQNVFELYIRLTLDVRVY